jgi:hypothetical protein
MVILRLAPEWRLIEAAAGGHIVLGCETLALFDRPLATSCC